MFVKIKVDFFNEKHLGKERAKENGESGAIGKDGLRFSENTFFEAKLLLFSGNGNVKKRT